MAWEFELIGKQRSRGNIVATVRISNADLGESWGETIPGDTLTDEWFAEWVRLRKAALEARDARFEALTIGKITPAEVKVDEAAEFFAKRATLEKLKQADAESLKDHSAEIASLEVEVKEKYRAEYLQDFRWR